MTVVEDWNGNDLKKFLYNGGSIFTLNDSAVAAFGKTGNNFSHTTNYQEPAQTCYYEDWYVPVYTFDENDVESISFVYSYTQYLGCTSDGSVPNGGGAPSAGDYGSVHAGSGSGGIGDDGSIYNSPNTELCATYNFKKVGSSFTGTIINLSWAYGNATNAYTVSYSSSCISIPNYNINQAQASIIFNNAFNSATNEILVELSEGVLTPIGVQTRLKSLIQTYLTLLKPGASWSANGPCSGNVPSTTININSYCG